MKKRRLIFNNDGVSLCGPGEEAPIGVEGLIREALEPLIGTHVDTFCWTLEADVAGAGLNGHFSNIYTHDTQIGDRWGEGREQFETAQMWRLYENYTRMIGEGNDPPGVIVETCRRVGIEPWLWLRMNDCHDGLTGGWGGPTSHQADLPMHPSVSRMKREHPEWLLGPLEGATFQMHRYAFNFMVPEVREQKFRLIEEACLQYDADGFGLDFCRHPRFFHKEDVETGRTLMTDLIRRIRERMNEIGREKGHNVVLAVRVPPLFSLCRHLGLEVDRWIREGLIDVLIPGTNVGCMQRLPVEEFIGACKGTEIQVYPHIGIAPQGNRPKLSPLWKGRSDYYSDAMFRAIAANYWAAGVDGLFLWNNQMIDIFFDLNWDHRPWSEIGEPAIIASMDKHYIVDQDTARLTHLAPPELIAIPDDIVLPVTFPEAGPEATASVPFDIADDPGSPVFETAILRVRVEQMTERDNVTFTLNGSPLDKAKITVFWNDCWIEFDVRPPLLRQGRNVLEVAVLGRNPRIMAPLVLADVEILVNYRKLR